MLKRIFALILCALMCVSLLPVSAFAVDDMQIEAETEEIAETEAPGDIVDDDDPDDAGLTEEISVEPETELTKVSEAEEPPADGEGLALEELPAVEADAPKLESAGETVTSGECGDNLTWTLDENGVLTISGTGSMYDYDMTNTAPWFEYRDQISSIVFNGFVQSIGDYAFQFTGISGAFAIPGSVSTIGEGAFQSTRITSLSIMSRTDIAAYAFGGCSSLTDIYYSGSSEMWSEMVTVDAEGNGYFVNAALHCAMDPTPVASLEELKALVEASDGTSVVRASCEGTFEFSEDFSGNVWLTADTLRVDSGVSVSLIGVETTTLDNEGSLSCITATVHGFDHPNIGQLDVSGSVSCVFEVSNESDLMDAEWFQYGAIEMGLPVDVVSISVVDDITLTEDRWFSSVIFIRNGSILTVPEGITLGIESAAINPNLSGAFHVEDGSVQVYGNIYNNTGIDVCADGVVALYGSGTYGGTGALQVHCGSADDIETMLPGLADMFAFELSGTDQYGLNIYTADNGLINPGDGTVVVTDPAYFADAVEMANNGEIYWITCEFEDTLELWDGLSFTDGMYVLNLLIPEGAEVDIPSVICENITVEGTLNANNVTFSGELVGRENILCDSVAREAWPASVSEMEELLAEAETATDGIIRRINLVDWNLTLDDDLLIPENAELYIISGSLSVPSGCTLTLNGMLDIQEGCSLIVEGELVNNDEIFVLEGCTLELRNGGAVSGEGLYEGNAAYSEESFLAQFVGFDPDEVLLIYTTPDFYMFRYGVGGIYVDDYGTIYVASPEYMEEAVELGSSSGEYYSIVCNFDTFTAWDGMELNGSLDCSTAIIPEGVTAYISNVFADKIYVDGTLQADEVMYRNELIGIENIDAWRVCLYNEVDDLDGLYAAIAYADELPDGLMSQINVYGMDITIDEDTVLPANVVLNLYDTVVTVSSGSTLTVNGSVLVFPQNTASSILVEGELVNNGEMNVQNGGTMELRSGGSVSGSGVFYMNAGYSEEAFLARFIGFDPGQVTPVSDQPDFCCFRYNVGSMYIDENGNVIVLDPARMPEAVELVNSGEAYMISCYFDTFTAWDGMKLNGNLNCNNLIVPEGADVYVEIVFASNVTVDGTLTTNQVSFTDTLTGYENIAPGAYVTKDCYAYSADEVKAALAVEPEAEGIQTRIYAFPEQNELAIDEDLTIPEYAVLDTSGSTLTVNSGCTLTVDGELSAFAFESYPASKVLVKGELVNNGTVYMQASTFALLDEGCVSGLGLYISSMDEITNQYIDFDPEYIAVVFSVPGEYYEFHYGCTLVVNYLNVEDAFNPNPVTAGPNTDIVLQNAIKAGYTFNGWYKEPEFKTKVTKIPAGSEGEFDLYAKWTPIKYTIAFNANGGTGSMAAMTSLDYDTEYQLTANKFTRKGYTFTGWNTEADGSGYASGDCWWVMNFGSVSGEKVTFYAQWEPISYIVCFDANGADLGEMRSIRAVYDGSVSLPANEFSRIGYTFAGWNTKADGRGTNYADGATVKNLTANADEIVVLYAKWTANKYYAVFDGNGATSGSMAKQPHTYDKSLALTANGFKKTGFAFDGWALDENATEAVYANKEIVTNLTDEANGEFKLFAVWKPLATAVELTCSDLGSGDLAGQTADVDMADHPSVAINAEILPLEASRRLTWKTSSASIAKVDENGVVTFVKPGSVTITATTADGSGKSAAVKLNVIYKYPSGSLSAKSVDLPTIGLQDGDSAYINVYAPDKTTVIDPADLEYSVKVGSKDGSEYLTVDETGKMTASGSGVTVTVTAALRGDPLNRKTTLSVKLIPVQTAEVFVQPGEGEIQYLSDETNVIEPGFYGVDEDGNIAQNADDAVSYALYVNKIPKGGAAETYTIAVSALNSDDELIEGDLKGQFTWASSNIGLATVKEDSAGNVVITVKPNVDGACTVSATSKDIAKVKGTIAVYIMDYTPRIGATSITLNTTKGEDVLVPLVESYGNTINNVELYEYNSATRKYDIPCEHFWAEYLGNEVLIGTDELLPNGTTKAQLVVNCAVNGADGEPYRFNLNIISKTVLPSITVTQPKTEVFQLMYKDSESNVSVTAKSGTTVETVSSAEVDTTYNQVFTGYGNDGEVKIWFNDGKATFTPKSKSIKLIIRLEGWDFPVEKTFTLATGTAKPSYSVVPASGIVRTALNEIGTSFSFIDKATGEAIELDEGAVTAVKAYAFAEVEQQGDDVYVQLIPKADGSYAGGTVEVNLQQDNWMSAIKYSFKVSVINTTPTVKLASSSLTLNRIFVERTASTKVTFNQADLSLDTIVYELKSAPKGAAVTKDSFSLEAVNGEIVAGLNEAVPNGSYSFSVIATAKDDYGNEVEAGAVTLKVTVNSAIPTVKLSRSTLTLHKVFNDRVAEAEAVVSLEGYTVNIKDILPSSTGSTAEQANKIGFSYMESGGMITAYIKDPYDLPTGSSYSYNVYMTVSGEGGESEVIKTTLKVSLNSTMPKVKLSSTTMSLNLNSITAGLEQPEITLTPDNGFFIMYPYSGIDSISRLDTGAKLAESEKIQVSLVENEGFKITASLDPENLPAAGTYNFSYTPRVCDEPSGQDAELAAIKFTVKVYNGKPAVSVSASGKLDTVNRDGSSIVYTMTKQSNISGIASGYVELTGTDAELFEIESMELNAKGQPQTTIKLKEDAVCSTAKTYKVRLRYEIDGGNGCMYVESSDLSIKPTQSSLKLTATPTTQTYYQSQSRDKTLTYTVNLTSPAGAKISSVDIDSVNFWQKSLADQAKEIDIDINGTTATISVTMKDTSIFSSGKSYTLPLLVTAEGSAENAKPTKISLTLKVVK